MWPYGNHMFNETEVLRYQGCNICSTYKCFLMTSIMHHMKYNLITMVEHQGIHHTADTAISLMTHKGLHVKNCIQRAKPLASYTTSLLGCCNFFPLSIYHG